jgi:hypothetical protein
MGFPVHRCKKGDLSDDKIPLAHRPYGKLNLTVTFFETLHASGGVNQLLFARKKRMACGADLGGDLLTGGTCLESVAAQTLDGDIGIYRVDTFFHYLPPLYRLKKPSRYSQQIFMLTI